MTDYHQPVFVGYGEEGRKLICPLSKQIEGQKKPQVDRWLMRRLQRYSVNLTRRDHERLKNDGFIKEVAPGLFVQTCEEMYSQDIGVVIDAEQSSENLVC